MDKINEFFELPEHTRQLIIDIHNKQKEIRSTRDLILEERRKLNTREANNQLKCDHVFAEKKYKAHENEFGNLTGGGVYHHYCGDCLFRWTVDNGSHGPL